MELKANCICLKANDYRDSDKIVTLASLEYGKIVASAKGVKGQKAKLKIACNPFTFGEYIFSKAKNRYIITGCSIERLFENLWTDIDKNKASSMVTNILDAILFENQENRTTVFNALLCLKAINDCLSYPFSYVLWFELNLASDIGFDIYDQNISDNIMSVLVKFQKVQPEDIDALELGVFDIDKALNCIDKLLKVFIN